jgi:formylglycine-generating enzyme required for sulfatase activity
VRALLILPLLALAPAETVRVPSGWFWMGGGDEVDERPRHRVFVSAFELDRDEVTRERYAACVRAGACAPPASDGAAGLPVTGVSWNDAAAFCRFAGGRLPSEAEWEKAARGTDGRVYPWGDEPRCDRANFGNFEGEGRCPRNPGAPVEPGRFGAESPYGARDLAGNVWEWVNDYYSDKYYSVSPARDPAGPPSGRARVVRGGACCSMFGLPRAANRLAFPADYRDVDLGFRCAHSTK